MIGDPLEELKVHSVVFVVEDEFLVQGYRGVEFLLKVVVSWFGQHVRNIIRIIMGRNLAFRLYYWARRQRIDAYLAM